MREVKLQRFDFYLRETKPMNSLCHREREREDARLTQTQVVLRAEKGFGKDTIRFEEYHNRFASFYRSNYLIQNPNQI